MKFSRHGANGRHKRRVAISALAVALVASACGGSGDSDEGADDTTTTTTEAATTTSQPATTTSTTTTTEATTTTTEAPPEMLDAGIVCVMSNSSLDCLSDDGWSTWDASNSAIRGRFQAMDVCPDGRVVTEDFDELAVLDGDSWTTLPIDPDLEGPDHIACGRDAIWLGGFEYVGFVADGEWTVFEAEEVLGDAEFVTNISDVQIGPDGATWVATGRSVARYLDGEWTAWWADNGFDDDVFPSAIAFDDSSPTVYVSSGFRGMLTFDGTEWTATDLDLSGDDALAVSDGVVYVSQFEAGVRVFDNGAGSTLGPDQGLTSIEVKDITVDADGRVWFATQAGLTVIDGDDVVGYRMDNSDLSDNRTHVVATAGPGVTLPEPQEEPLAGMAGVFLDATGSPLAGAAVEICLDAIDDSRTTPCTGQTVVFETTTDSSGRFEFTEVPAGRYSLGVQRPTGRWTYFVDGVISNNYEATQDEINELGAFSLSAEEESEDG